MTVCQLADYLTIIVDTNIAVGTYVDAQIIEGITGGNEDVKIATGCLRRSDYLPQIIDFRCLAIRAAKRPQIRHDAILPDEGMISAACCCGYTNDLPGIINAA